MKKYVARFYKGGIFCRGKGKGVKPCEDDPHRNQHDAEFVFTDDDCLGNRVRFAEDHGRFSLKGTFETFSLCEDTGGDKDYGFGKGLDPIATGCL